MQEPTFDADELLRLLADAVRAPGSSKEFSWDADVALQRSLRRLTAEMPTGVGVVVDTDDGPALMLVSHRGAALVRIADRRAETTFLGELVGGMFRETEEQIDARHSAITMRFEQSASPAASSSTTP